MKLTPLALLSLSSAGDKPSRMLGVLSASLAVKYHWFGLCSGAGLEMVVGEACADEAVLLREVGRGGDVREV